MIAWSYGGGVQSAAIGVLIREGVLPVPDLAVIADTGREKQTTWDYLHNVMRPYLKPVGVTICISPPSLKRVDLYDADGLTLMPAFTAKGRLPSFCSGEWKRDAIERWLRLQGVKACTQWLGFSLDEVRRVKKPHRSWCQLAYPLIEKRIDRDLCYQLIKGAGLPVPLKSRCWQCPHQTPEEWEQIRSNREEWQKAIQLDEEIRSNDPKNEGLYLHYSRVPLAMADDSTGLVPPSRPCEGGHCFT
jgi:hypothetical protein